MLICYPCIFGEVSVKVLGPLGGFLIVDSEKFSVCFRQ